MFGFDGYVSYFGKGDMLFWWALLAFGVAGVLLLVGSFRWISSDPGIERDVARADFRAEQDFRALRRAGKITSR